MSQWLFSTKNWIKKQYFNSTHYLEILTNQGDKLLEGDVYINGRKFHPDNRKQALELYQSVLWFTYRENIQFQDFPEIKSDVGWGCMLRVGQMMLAHLLRIKKGPQFYSNQGYLSRILNEFISSNGRFSIESLAKAGRRLLRKKPGEWYSSYDISIVLKEILEQGKKLEQKDKVEGQFLQTIITNSQFSLKSVYQQIKFGKQKYVTKPCLLIVICRIGYDKPEASLLKTVTDTLKNEVNCIGILGGRPGKAHFIFGTTQKSFIYLDPHCVKNQIDMQSFLCQNLFTMPHDKLDPSLGLCFYLDNFSQLIKTHQRLRKMQGCKDVVYCHEFQGFSSGIFQTTQELQEEVYQILQ